MFESAYFSLEQVGEGVFAAIARSEESGEMANAGLIDLGDLTVAFDSFMLPGSARELLRASQELLGRPVSLLVISHYHPDHIRGSCVFPAETVVITTTRTRDLIVERDVPGLPQMLRDLPETIEKAARQYESAAEGEEQRWNGIRLKMYRALSSEIGPLEARMPQLTFEQGVTLHGAQRRCEVVALGEGHSPSDTVLYLPDERILFCGDLLFNGQHPFIADSDPDGWRRILDDLETWEIETVVPGHGPAGRKADLLGVRDYLARLEELAREIIAGGGSADDAVAIPIPADLAGLASLRFHPSLQFMINRLAGQE